MIGIVGGGYWGKNLIREFNACGVLGYICDINENALKEHVKTYPSIKNTFTSLDEMLLQEDMTMVCIALPAEMHYDACLKALNANKDVFVEKPFVLNVEQGEELVRLAKEKNRILMVGHIMNYHMGIQHIKRILKEEVTGPIKYITCNRKSHGIYRQCENVFWSFAVHDMSVILSLFNNPILSNISCNSHGFITSGIADVCNTSFIINNNVYVNINVDWNSPRKEQNMTIVCQNKIIVFDNVLNRVEVFNNYITESKVANKTLPEITTFTGTPLQNECEHFIACCKDRQTPLTDGNEGLRVVKAMLQCNPVVTETPFIHPSSIVDSGSLIGTGTKIWHWCHITEQAIIGNKCSIGQNCYVAGTLGNNCKLQNNVSIYLGVKAGNNVFFGPSCVLTNDKSPRSGFSKHGKYIETTIEDDVTIGANATIVCGITLGKGCMIGAGSVVAKNVRPNTLVIGNPAREIGVVFDQGDRLLYKDGIELYMLNNTTTVPDFFIYGLQSLDRFIIVEHSTIKVYSLDYIQVSELLTKCRETDIVINLKEEFNKKIEKNTTN